VNVVLVQPCPPHNWAHSPTVGCFTCMKCSERVNFDDKRYVELLDQLSAPVFGVDQASESPQNIGPITAEELTRRGVSDDVEGRALDVVFRCGWPRPGDPLGIKPCIPIEMRELREVLKDAEDVINMTARVELLVTFLQRKLRTQEYVMALYVEAADARAGS
jgi:hypothetical protein